ncbi:MAG: site-2 protease family protein [Bryobacteraceae bacterium]
MAAFGSPAQQLEELAIRARQLAAIGQLKAARDLWMTALQLVSPESGNYRAVQREIEKIDARLAPRQPGHKTDWKKRLGPLGILIAALIKFKTVALVLLTKGKFLISILAFVGVYWSLFGWWFAVGLSGSVLLHEMGHYIMVRRFGFAAELPMFLPGFGAYVKWNGANVDPGIRAQISLAGPLFGLISGLISYGIFLETGHGVWLAVAHLAGWLNLLNLIPVLIFDGASAMNAIGMQGRLALLAVSLVMWFMLHENLFLFLAIGTGYRIWKRDVPAQPNQGIAYYFIALAVANGSLSWFSVNRAQVLFPR